MSLIALSRIELIPTLLIGIIRDIVAGVTLRSLMSFPNPVNETSARLVAAGVVAQAILFLVLREWWVLVPLTYGFLARVATCLLYTSPSPRDLN